MSLHLRRPRGSRKAVVVATASLLVLASGCGSDTTASDSADAAAADAAAAVAGAAAETTQPNGTKGLFPIAKGAAEAAAPDAAAADAAAPDAAADTKAGLSGRALIDAGKWADSLVREICRSLRPTDIDRLAQRIGVTADELKELCGIPPSTLPGGKNFTCGVLGCGRPQVADAIVSDLCKAALDRGNPATMQILAERLGTSAEALARACFK